MASIRFRNSRFEARVRVDGRSHSKSFTSIDKAKRWAASLELGVVKPSSIRGQPDSSVTVSQAADRYLKEVVPKHKGAKQEAERIRQIKRLEWANEEARNITSANVRAYRDQMLCRGLSTSTVRLMLSLLSSIFRFLSLECGLDVGNPVSGVRMPPPPPARCRRLTEYEEQRLLEALGDCKNRWMRAAAEFTLETGMRRSELLGLTWQSINWGTQTATLSETKNGSRRWVPLSDKAIEILAKQQEASLEKPFPLSVSLLTQAWGHAVRRAGIDNLRWHDLRHESLSRWAHRLNGDVFKLASVSGHKTLQMAQRYVHPVYAEVLAKTQ